MRAQQVEPHSGRLPACGVPAVWPCCFAPLVRRRWDKPCALWSACTGTHTLLMRLFSRQAAAHARLRRRGGLQWECLGQQACRGANPLGFVRAVCALQGTSSERQKEQVATVLHSYPTSCAGRALNQQCSRGTCLVRGVTRVRHACSGQELRHGSESITPRAQSADTRRCLLLQANIFVDRRLGRSWMHASALCV